jgi:hypothetical protein
MIQRERGRRAMSNAEPMSLRQRVDNYARQAPGRPLTPKQSRRAGKKDRRNPVAGYAPMPGYDEVEVKDELL